METEKREKIREGNFSTAKIKEFALADWVIPHNWDGTELDTEGLTEWEKNADTEGCYSRMINILANKILVERELYRRIIIDMANYISESFDESIPKEAHSENIEHILTYNLEVDWDLDISKEDETDFFDELKIKIKRIFS